MPQGVVANKAVVDDGNGSRVHEDEYALEVERYAPVEYSL
jgi:hypothetical protein